MFFYFIFRGDSLKPDKFSFAVINFTDSNILLEFTKEYNGLVIKDHLYPLIVQFAIFQQVPPIDSNFHSHSDGMEEVEGKNEQEEGKAKLEMIKERKETKLELENVQDSLYSLDIKEENEISPLSSFSEKDNRKDEEMRMEKRLGKNHENDDPLEGTLEDDPQYQEFIEKLGEERNIKKKIEIILLPPSREEKDKHTKLLRHLKEIKTKGNQNEQKKPLKLKTKKESSKVAISHDNSESKKSIKIVTKKQNATVNGSNHIVNSNEISSNNSLQSAPVLRYKSMASQTISKKS